MYDWIYGFIFMLSCFVFAFVLFYNMIKHAKGGKPDYFSVCIWTAIMIHNFILCHYFDTINHQNWQSKELIKTSKRALVLLSENEVYAARKEMRGW